jgi:hypothetical protein
MEEEGASAEHLYFFIGVSFPKVEELAGRPTENLVVKQAQSHDSSSLAQNLTNVDSLVS